MRSLLIGFVLAQVATAALAAEPVPTLDAVQAQFFYRGSGTLSRDIAPPANFGAWNTLIGEGSAAEPANDLLVSARLSVPTDEALVNTPLTITATAKGRTVARRQFPSMLFSHGKAVAALFVPDAACMGDVTIQAVIGRQKKAATLHLDCGE